MLSESASNKAAFEQIQAAAAALENRCADLAAANEELTTQRAALAGENDALRSSNAELGARLEAVEAAHAEEAGRLAGELEALKGEVKAAVEEFVDGMISADNLRARCAPILLARQRSQRRPSPRAHHHSRSLRPQAGPPGRGGQVHRGRRQQVGSSPCTPPPPRTLI